MSFSAWLKLVHGHIWVPILRRQWGAGLVQEKELIFQAADNLSCMPYCRSYNLGIIIDDKLQMMRTKLEFQSLSTKEWGQTSAKYFWEEQFWLQFSLLYRPNLGIFFCVSHDVPVAHQKAPSFEQDMSYSLEPIFSFLLLLKTQNPSQSSKEIAVKDHVFSVDILTCYPYGT